MCTNSGEYRRGDTPQRIAPARLRSSGRAAIQESALGDNRCRCREMPVIFRLINATTGVDAKWLSKKSNRLRQSGQDFFVFLSKAQAGPTGSGGPPGKKPQLLVSLASSARKKHGSEHHNFGKAQNLLVGY